MIVHTFDLSTQEIEAGDSLEFEARLLYIVVSRTVRATPVSKWEGGPNCGYPEGQFFNCSLCTHFHLSAQRFPEASV